MLLYFSKKDAASHNIFKRMQEIYKISNNKIRIKGKEYDFVLSDKLHLYVEDKNTKDKTIFISKHRSDKTKACFTIHFTGNFSKALYGGKDYSLSFADPFMRFSFEPDFFEATHHGPSLNKASIFIELGSRNEDYKNEKHINAFIDFFEAGLKENNIKKSSAIIGGSHYYTKDEIFSLEDKYSLKICHIMPKYAIDDNYKHSINEIINKSKNLEMILLNKNKLKKKSDIISYIKEKNIDFVLF